MTPFSYQADREIQRRNRRCGQWPIWICLALLVLVLYFAFALAAHGQTIFILSIWNTDPRWPGAIMVRVEGGDANIIYEVQSSADLVNWEDEARMPAGEDWILELYPHHTRMFYRAKLLGSATAAQWDK